MTQSHTEISEPTPAVTPEVIPPAGPILQAARLAKNLSVADVATRMHVRPSIVEDIERDCFDNIASPIYVKGYVKNFARIVGADEAAIKASIYAQLPSEEKPVMQSFSRKTTIKARDSRLMLVTWLIAFVLLALMVLWWVQKSNTDTLVDLSKPSIEEVAAIHSTPSLAHDADLLLATEADALAPGITAEQLQPEDTATTVDAPIDGAASSPINAGAQSAPAVTPSAVTAPATNTQSTAPVINSAANSAATPMTTTVTQPVSTAVTDVNVSTGQGELSLSLSGDCWMKIIDGSGKTLVNGVKTAGSVMNLQGDTPFKIIIGAPNAVTMTFNGAPVSLSAYQDKVARFTLPSPMSE